MVNTYENVDTGEVLELDEFTSLIRPVETAPGATASPLEGTNIAESIKCLDVHVAPIATVSVDAAAKTYRADAYSSIAEAAGRTDAQRLLVRLVLLLLLPFLMAGMAQAQWKWDCNATQAVVPVTLQTLAAILNGVLLGRAYGTLATALYVLYIALGLQGAAGGSALTLWRAGGLGYTGGYVLGFILLTACVGHATARGDGRFRLHRALCSVHRRGACVYIWPSASSASLLRFIGWVLAGHVAMYTLGILWLQSTLSFNTSTGLKQGLVCFIPGDVVKIAIAVLCVPLLWRASTAVLHRWRHASIPVVLRTPVAE